MTREQWLEDQMDRDDFDMSLFQQYSDELNAIQTSRNERIQKRKQDLAVSEQTQREQDLLDKALSLTDQDVDAMYRDFIQLNAGQRDEHGRTFEDWMNIALSLYQVNLVGKEFEVVSLAKSDEGFTWRPFVSMAQARSKILELLKIKFRDHHTRADRDGCDFANIPTQN